MTDTVIPFPITILTGFLGSGKTTLLKNLLQQDDMANAAVIINEFGEVGLDHMLVETSTEDMIIMDSGCLCCTIRGDMIETLRDLLKKRWNKDVPAFDRVIIETTGLADPAPIIHTIMTDAVISHRYRLDGIITCLDAVNGQDQLDAQEEAVKQAAVADKILFTKTDLLTAENNKFSDLKSRVDKINPTAAKLEITDGKIAAKELTGLGLFDPDEKTPDVKAWLKEEAFENEHDHGHHHHHGHEHSHGHHHHHDVNRHSDGIRAFSFHYDQPIKWDNFVEWMESMTASHGTDLLRMKGILNVVEAPGPVVVHGVQHVFHPPAQLEKWPDEDKRSRFVMITRNINREPIEATFNSFMNM